MKKVLGIDLGGSKIRLVEITENGDTLKRSISALEGKHFEQIFAKIMQIIKENLDGDVKAIGLGVPGPIKNGKIITCVNLRGFEGKALDKLVEEKVGLPIVMENDAAAALRGELWRGEARGIENVFLITLGTGVGGALAQGRKIVANTMGLAGEFGHSIVDTAGPLCECGQKGCLEAFWKGKNNQDQYLAQAINNMFKKNNIDLIIIGGGVATPEKIDLINTEIEKISREKLPLKKAKLGEWAGAIGAAKLAIDYGT